MTRFALAPHGLVRLASLAAAAMLMVTMAPAQRAEALSPISGGGMPITKQSGDNPLIQARFGGGGHGGGGFHGGGGGFRGGFGGGGFRGGGFHGGGFRGGFVGGPRFGGGRFYGGGPRFYGGPRIARYGYGWRRPFYRPRFYGGYYPYYGYGFYRPRACRIVFTYYGPRRICRPFYRPYWRYRYY